MNMGKAFFNGMDGFSSSRSLSLAFLRPFLPNSSGNSGFSWIGETLYIHPGIMWVTFSYFQGPNQNTVSSSNRGKSM